jgi:hypothetical protein
MSGILNFQDNQLIDGGEFVSLSHRPCSTPHNLFYFCLWYLNSIRKFRSIDRIELYRRVSNPRSSACEILSELLCYTCGVVFDL